jgi:hypothetical protein
MKGLYSGFGLAVQVLLMLQSDLVPLKVGHIVIVVSDEVVMAE